MDLKPNLSKKDLESFIAIWNVKFPYDRLYRKKYNIPFGSKQHLEASQIDIYLDLLEDRCAVKAQINFIERNKNLEDYKRTGNFLKEEMMSKEEEDKLLSKVKF